MKENGAENGRKKSPIMISSLSPILSSVIKRKNNCTFASCSKNCADEKITRYYHWELQRKTSLEVCGL